MPQLTINNVDIDFPFEPYKCQEDYMSHVIKALQMKQNAILESPTGTGKTLCLLCSVLAWRLTYVAKLQLNGLSSNTVIKGLDEAAGDDSNMAAFNAIPKIIYASRTHSQISQVVKELRNTIYKPKVSVLGSRDQLCLHPKVMNIENAMAKIHTCRAKVKERSCVHYTNIDKKINDPIYNEIMDIEDLVSVSREKIMCPYYSSRELLRRADIIFMPYNYLIDTKTRKNQNISLENSIIIFDEAHNIERVCEESYSFEITSLDIANCIENCQIALQKILDEDAGETNSSGPSYENNELSKEDVLTMKAIFLSLEREFNKLEVRGEGNVIDKSTFKNLLASINVNQETKGLITEVLEKMESVLSVSSSNKITGNTFIVLNNFMQILDLTLEQKESSRHQYVCYVSKERKDKKRPFKGWGDHHNMESVAPIFFTKLSYWCFSPGLAMEEFARQGVYSIILTSGTLSPLNSFSAELKIPFPITLQNPHVIEPNQISVQVLCKGCDNEEFLSTYKNRNNPKYLSSLGNSIVNLLRIIPNGVLVFFPSYGVMNTCIKAWQDNNIFNRMMKIKVCFIEPRSKGEMASVMTEFDSKVRSPTDGTTGAILFAVCRGKASEGIDFADMHGRAVIITGLPFPPKVDPKVNAKINYLDQQKRQGNKLLNALNGNEWYIQQSSRAVNQAVGRVIRHKDDFGAVIFMDKRFSYKSNIQELPLWAKGFTKVNEKFGSGLRELSQFFKLHVAREAVKVEEAGETQGKTHVSTLSNLYQNFQQKAIEKKMNGEDVPLELDTSTKDMTPPPRKMARTMKRDSLITSLNTASSSDFVFPPSMSPVSTKTSKPDYTTPVAMRNPKKRIRIVQQASNSRSLFDLSAKGIEKENISSKELSAEEQKNPQKYSALLHSSLSTAEYGTFKGIIVAYRKSNDITALIDSITELFLLNHKQLLKGFRVFLKSNHQQTFDKCIAEKLK